MKNIVKQTEILELEVKALTLGVVEDAYLWAIRDYDDYHKTVRRIEVNTKRRQLVFERSPMYMTEGYKINIFLYPRATHCTGSAPLWSQWYDLNEDYPSENTMVQMVLDEVRKKARV